MLVPPLCAGIKQSHYLPRIRVNGGKVRAFAEVTTLTCPGEIRKSVRTRVLPCDHVVRVEWPKREIVLVETAVLATPARAIANKSADARRHQAAECSAR